MTKDAFDQTANIPAEFKTKLGIDENLAFSDEINEEKFIRWEKMQFYFGIINVWNIFLSWHHVFMSK